MVIMQVMEAKRRVKNECGLISDVTSEESSEEDSSEDKKKKKQPKKAKGDVAEVYIIMESFSTARKLTSSATK